MCETTRTELYRNNEFKVISVSDKATGETSRLILVYDVDLHCATILSYHAKNDTYDVTFTHAFHRALVVLAAAYGRERITEILIDLRAAYRFMRGVFDYLRARVKLVAEADRIYKRSIGFGLPVI